MVSQLTRIFTQAEWDQCLRWATVVDTRKRQSGANQDPYSRAAPIPQLAMGKIPEWMIADLIGGQVDWSIHDTKGDGGIDGTIAGKIWNAKSVKPNRKWVVIPLDRPSRTRADLYPLVRCEVCTDPKDGVVRATFIGYLTRDDLMNREITRENLQGERTREVSRANHALVWMGEGLRPPREFLDLARGGASQEALAL